MLNDDWIDADNPESFICHKKLFERAKQMGISPREWMDSALRNDSKDKSDETYLSKHNLKSNY